MNHSDATFELIKELTQNEKRHFRVFSGTSGSDKNYLKVFDALDKMKIYDNKTLNKKLAGTKINVSYEKNYLHKQLQKSLRTFYSENNSSIQLLDILKTIEILYRKRLIAQCQKLVDRGIGIVEKYELWNFHLELIEWQYRIYARSGNYKKLDLYEKEGLHEKKKLLETIGTYAAVQNEIYSMVLIANDRGIYIRKKLKDACRKVIARCLPVLKKHETEFRIPELIYSTLYFAAHFSGDLKKAYHYSLSTYRLYNKYPHFKNDLPFKFFVAIGSLINRCIHLKKYEEGLGYISELKLFVKHLPAFAT
ncbi:MAG TPA: hypothetical protein VFJ43_08060, partial [Bacteroidia bacterium]|nr:hypothetical protein [Bacteroidia bacterium]